MPVSAGGYGDDVECNDYRNGVVADSQGDLDVD